MAKRGRVIASIIVALIIIIAIGAVVFNTQQTIFGVSNVQITGEGDRVIITATPGSEEAIISVSQSQLNSELEADDLSAERGVSVKLDTISFAHVYPLIKNQGEDYFILQEENFGKSLTTNLIQHCESKGANNVVDAYEKGSFFPDIICVSRKPIATRGQVSGTQFDEFVVQVDAAGDTEFITDENQVVSLANDDIRVSFEGELPNLQSISEVPFDMEWRNGAFQHLVSRNSLVLQNNALDQFRSCVASKSVGDESGRQACQRVYNDKILFDVLEDKNSDFESGIIESINLGTTSNENKGFLRAALVSGSAPFPLVRIEVDGDFLGIKKLIGEPEITSCVSNIDTDAGNDEDLKGTIKIKNVGDESGTFLISKSCNNPKIDVLMQSTTFVDPSETVTLNAIISASSEQLGSSETGTCTIEVTDKNSGKSDSCNFGVSVEFATVLCNADQKQCSDDATEVLGCNSQGTSLELVEKCADDEKCALDENLESACVKKSVADVITGVGGKNDSTECEDCDAFVLNTVFGGFMDSQSCEPKGPSILPPSLGQNNTTCTFSWFKMVVAPLLFLAILIFGGIGLMKLDTFSSTIGKVFAWIIAFIVALILAVFVYNIFLIGTIIAVIVLVVFIWVRRVF